jgi:LuxR family maltose regulon positive regulatory protein
MRHAPASPKAMTCGATLTPREWQVLQLLPTHLSVDAIGGSLGMRRSTAKTHVAHVYRKLGVRHRADAVDVARARSLVPPAAVPPVASGGEAERDRDARG